MVVKLLFSFLSCKLLGVVEKTQDFYDVLNIPFVLYYAFLVFDKQGESPRK